MNTVLTVGDIDGDGRADEVLAGTGPTGNPALELAWGQKDGTFLLSSVAIPVPTDELATATIGDLNHDGIADLMVSVVPNAWEAILGLPDGGFRVTDAGQTAFAIVGDAGYSYPIIEAVLADLNGDGALDALFTRSPTGSDASSQGSALSILFGRGDGTFQPEVQLATPVLGGKVWVGPLGDAGAREIIQAGPNAQAQFEAVTTPILADGGFGTQATTPLVNFQAVVSADFNGDGVPDLAGVSFTNVTVLLGAANGEFTSSTGSQSLFPLDANVTAAAVVDLNRDGIPDIVALDDIGFRLMSAIGVGGGYFEPGPIVALGDDPSSLFLGDVTGDGATDVVVESGAARAVEVSEGGSAALLQGPRVIASPLGEPSGVLAQPSFQGGATLALSVDFGPQAMAWTADAGWSALAPIGLSSCMDNISMYAGDITGAGSESLVFVSRFSPCAGGSDSASQAAQPLADGGFSVGPVEDLGAAVDPLFMADFTGDGRADLLGSIGSGSSVGTVVLLALGDGGFGAPVSALGAYPLFPVAGDFNGDHIPDLVWSDQGLSSTSLSFSHGDGSFGPTVGVLGVGGPAAAGDFNGDGALDLVVGGSMCPASGSLTLLLGDGTGGFASPVVFGGPSSGIVGVAAADFNGDGILDVAAIQGENAVVLWLGNGDGTFQSGSAFPGTFNQLIPLAIPGRWDLLGFAADPGSGSANFPQATSVLELGFGGS